MREPGREGLGPGGGGALNKDWGNMREPGREGLAPGGGGTDSLRWSTNSETTDSPGLQI